MKYEDAKENDGTPKPHKDHLINIGFSDRFMRQPKIVDFLKKHETTVYFTRVGPNALGLSGSNLSAIGFQWMKKGAKFACPISFHQDHAEFVRELHRFFGIKEIVYDPGPEKRSRYGDIE